jgi:hypothetical protein
MLLHLFYFVVWILFYLIWFRKFYLKKVLENKQIKKRKKKKKKRKQLTFSPGGPKARSGRPVLPRPRRWAAAAFPSVLATAWAGPRSLTRAPSSLLLSLTVGVRMSVVSSSSCRDRAGDRRRLNRIQPRNLGSPTRKRRIGAIKV